MDDRIAGEAGVTTKRRWTIRRLILLVAVIAFLFGIVRPAYLIFDALAHGPYTVSYNRECQRLADQAQLVGRPEEDVIKVLGHPTEIWDYESNGRPVRTYNDFPAPIAAGIFQVHCSRGVVKGLEQLDD